MDPCRRRGRTMWHQEAQSFDPSRYLDGYRGTKDSWRTPSPPVAVREPRVLRLPMSSLVVE